MRRLALLATTFALAAFAVGMIARAPAAQTTNQGANEACQSGRGSIPAAALPETVDLDNCPIRGKVITDHGVGTVLPGPGQGVHVEALTTEGAQELEVTRYRNGTVELEHAGDETEAARSEPEIGAASRSGECSDAAYNDEDWRVTAGFGYGFNRSTTPPEIGADAAEGAIKAGGTNITSVHNNCRLPDEVPAELTYLGNTNATADIIGDRCDTNGGDGNNVVSFGDLSGGTLAVACTRFAPNPSGYDEVTESDIKINKADFKWTTNPRPRSCKNKYDLQSVMTHERGHTFGLGHVSESAHGKLTMSPLIGACQKSPRALGKGDVLGLNNKYP